MDRRHFVRASLFGLLSVGLAGASGCGGESHQTGTMVETPSEDKESMEKSAAAYRSMQRPQGAPAK